MRALALIVLGILVGSLSVGFPEKKIVPDERQITDCSVSENAADRCDHALLTCLSVQVRFIHELEQLQSVCAR